MPTGRRISSKAFAEAWHDTSLTTDDIAALFGVHRSSVSYMGRARGLPPRKLGPKPKIAREPFATWWIAGVGAQDIADALGITRNYTTVLARRLGLPNRPQGARKVISLADFRALQLRAAMAASARETEAALQRAQMKDGYRDPRNTGRKAA